MTLLIQGEDDQGSRNEVLRMKEAFEGEITQLEGKELTKENLIQNIQSTSLFEVQKRMVILDNLLGNKNWDEFPENLQSDAEVVLWEGKKLTPAQVAKFQKLFPGLAVKEFKVEQEVFRFLEALRPGNTREMLNLWGKYRAREVPEIILVMIVRQFRLLMLAKANSLEGPAEWLRVSPWQKQKMAAQAKFFSEDQMKGLYRELLQIDFQVKTGQLPHDLSAALELFLLSL